MTKKDKRIKFTVTSLAAVLLIASIFPGCKQSQTSQPAKPVQAQGEASQPDTLPVQQPETASQETVQEEGYIYQPRDRRDPFVPLIVPAKKAEARGAGAARLGTIESYDISEFALLAIARKGEKYYALLITPDNRSFTVSEGSVIGLHKGRVGEITGDKVILVEYAKDFRGDSRPKQIILELKER